VGALGWHIAPRPSPPNSDIMVAGEIVLEDSLLTRLAKAISPERRSVSDLYNAPPVSRADLFPGVPPPEDPWSPSILAARWASHDLYGEDMPGVAADLLERGTDTPSLRRLAGEMRVTHTADVKPLVEATLRELGAHCPLSDREAKLIASRQVAREVIHGQRNPWQAASHLEIAIWSWEMDSPELTAIGAISDEVSWDTSFRRSLDQLESDLLHAFARLAVMQI
jgi:hypothetical protein